ncbi:acyltransferase [Neorhizobium lilium]|uniref:Acyltransferase n=1 Tax=Neorhizobium lilium TaxID=2503024 RepID=A0A444LHE9_9HYPH|nr:acyltransferase [Neorhizobium lilium]RWX78453.1 acyltransferase [Neorhizobium lilium]
MGVRGLRVLLAVIAGGGRVKFGKRGAIRSGVRIDADKGSVRFGVEADIGYGAIIRCGRANIVIGDHFSLNPYSILYGGGGLTIGNNVRIAAHTTVIPANHSFDALDVPIRLQRSTAIGISIGNDVWIGANCVILDGAKIADGCVIAAGSVVRGETEPYGIYAGVPAKRIRFRGQSDRPSSAV